MTHATQRLSVCLLASLVATSPSGGGANAQDRMVQCHVESEGRVAFGGRCRFIPDQGGSFALAHPDPNRALYGRILSISVFIVSPGVAEVRGLTDAGNNSRWGEARRSRQDGACWVGTDFTICAR